MIPECMYPATEPATQSGCLPHKSTIPPAPTPSQVDATQRLGAELLPQFSLRPMLCMFVVGEHCKEKRGGKGERENELAQSDNLGSLNSLAI